MADDEKKKKKPSLWEAGKALYGAYMKRRKKMGETLPPLSKFGEGGIRKTPPPEPAAEAPAPTPPAEKPAEEQAEQPPKKKKKKRGGVGGVLDLVQERKRRMAEAAGIEPEKEENQ
jgi:hypothetical protein